MASLPNGARLLKLRATLRIQEGRYLVHTDDESQEKGRVTTAKFIYPLSIHYVLGTGLST